MVASQAVWRWVGVCLLAAICAGCFPVAENDQSDKKDPHYIRGRKLVNAMDYYGAAEAFEKALAANPRSAAAHLELGILNEERFNNFARAIYHYEKFLELDPNSPQAPNIRPRILACKQELAKTVSLGPVTQPLQKELDRLTTENQQLRQQVEALGAQLAQSQAALASAQRPSGTTALGGQPDSQPADQPTGGPAGQRPLGSANQRAFKPANVATVRSEVAPPASGSPRVHMVQSGDTLYSIARRYRVSLDAIRQANPGLDPRKLKVGQRIHVPGS